MSPGLLSFGFVCHVYICMKAGYLDMCPLRVIAFPVFQARATHSKVVMPIPKKRHVNCSGEHDTATHKAQRNQCNLTQICCFFSF